MKLITCVVIRLDASCANFGCGDRIIEIIVQKNTGANS